MIGPVARLSTQMARNVMRSFVRNGSHGGVPGENLPFNINNRKMLTFHVFWYMLTGLGAPFLIVELQLRKNRT